MKNKASENHREFIRQVSKIAHKICSHPRGFRNPQAKISGFCNLDYLKPGSHMLLQYLRVPEYSDI